MSSFSINNGTEDNLLLVIAADVLFNLLAGTSTPCLYLKNLLCIVFLILIFSQRLSVKNSSM